ncbi:nucleotidyl transferase AbiEii/AbiGii toxin family protein [Patescibacteria group bacterium]|nr:nucleotidyl transferase AbiEii/AbiGii toxin family protein [Patescibacteria group bacterium]
MNNIISNFDQILQFAKQNSIPVDRKRGVIREYLQSKFISIFYSLSGSEKMSFVGGSSLRLLRNLNRFSEDLDFDNLGLSNKEVISLVTDVVNRFHKEGFNLELREQITEGKTYFDLRFPNLLKDLKISTDPREKLMIKFDYTNNWVGQVTELVLFNKYGFIENVVANKLDQTMVQKLTAYVKRKKTQPRDIYDIVWLYSQGVGFDSSFAKKNKVQNVIKEALKKFKDEGIPRTFGTKINPFLFDSVDLRKLDLFGDVLEELDKKSK